MDPDAYVALVDAAGRVPDPRKRGMIPAHVTSVLEELNIDVQRWLEVVRGSTRIFGTAIGSAVSLAIEAARRGMKRIVGALDVDSLT